MTRRARLGLAAALAAIVAAGPGVALAAWAGAGSGSAWTKAVSAPTGATPSGSVIGRNVTVSWSAARFPDNTAVNGYTVRRYNGAHVAQTVGASCSGTINALTCTEAAVPPGTWTYTVTPEHGQWTGVESADSPGIAVGAPSLALAPATLATLPTTLNGTVANFITGETIIFRLDDPSTGSVLSGTVTSSPIPTSGGSAVTVTVPVLTPAGAHTIYAVGDQGSQASKAITINPNDTVGPVVSAALVAKTTGGSTGYVRNTGTFYVYANVTDVGSPAVGVSTVTADVSTIRTGTTAAAMTTTGGPWTVDGVAYNYRSASITANVAAEGTKAFSIKATDANANVTTQGGFSAVVDNTVPTATDIQTANGGATAGRAETGDSVTFTFSEPMDPNRILASWTGTSTSVTVRLTNGGGGDTMRIWNAADSAQLPFGTVNLGRTDYVSGGTRTFTGSTMVMSGSTVTVTLGTLSSGVTGTAAGTGTMVWSPSTTAWDRASNAMSAATRNETGGADAEF
ncbi:MAG TPA: hypothetical protein VIG53_05465 [Actinomycetota bacterium]